MDGQDQSLKKEKNTVDFLMDGKAATGGDQNNSQGRGGKDDPTQDNEKRRQIQPFAEKAGQAEKQRCGVDGKETSGTVQSDPIITKKRFSKGADLW
jgi:hypothetical protein